MDKDTAHQEHCDNLLVSKGRNQWPAQYTRKEIPKIPEIKMPDRHVSTSTPATFPFYLPFITCHHKVGVSRLQRSSWRSGDFGRRVIG